MIYVWQDLDSPKTENKLGDHFIENCTIEEAYEDIKHYIRNSLGRQKHKYDEGRVIIHLIHDASDYAKKKNRFGKHKKIDNVIGRHSEIAPYHKVADIYVGIEPVPFVDKILSVINELLTGIYRPDNYTMRSEQQDAVDKDVSYFEAGGKDFLFNCKMRFGKCFTAYQVMKRLRAQNTLILTYKPAVSGEWRKGLERHIDFVDYEFYNALDFDKNNPIKFKKSRKNSVLFASFQDILGKDASNNIKKKWLDILKKQYDLVIIDEVHFGAKTQKAIEIINNLQYKYKLELSGTPLELLMSGEYDKENTFTWSYVDEQKKRKQEEANNWATEVYKWLPPMSIHTYEYGESILKDEKYYTADEGLTLNKFFAANEDLTFINDAAVDNFLDLLSHPDDKIFKSPFNNNDIKKHLNHMFWVFESVASVKAMRQKLEAHSYFKQYIMITAADDNDGEGNDTLKLVKDAIRDHKKTITISCGKLNTGVTIPEWNAVFMLNDIESAETYWQTAFRVQSPDKENNKLECFLIDFNPNRTLKIAYDYAEQIAKGDQSTVQSVREFLDVMKVFVYRDNKLVKQNESFVEEIINCGINLERAIKKFESVQTICISKVTDDILQILSKVESKKGEKISITVSKSPLGKGKNFKTGKNKNKNFSKVENKQIIGKLMSVLQKIPTFMFLSDAIEEDLKQVLNTIEADLFEQVVGISLNEFKRILDAGSLNKKLLNRAIQSYYLATREESE